MEMCDMNNSQSDQKVPTAGRKYRILLVVRWPVGGIRTFIRYVYRHFEPELFHFTILGPENPEMDVLAEDLKGLDVDFRKVSARPSSYEFFKAILKLVLRSEYDLIHSHGFTSGVCAAIPALLSRRPHILTSHDVINKIQFKGINGWLKIKSMSMAFSMIQTIHSVSHDAQDNLFDHFPFLRYAGKSLVITHGIEVERFVNAKPRNLKAELGVGDDAFLIGFLGRFMSQKGFVYLVDAVQELSRKKQLPKQPLVVAFGEGGFIREEKQRLSEMGLKEYFLFLPFAENVASMIKGLDVVVMPSLWEACGLLAMETLVCGTPLIGTNCIGLREVLKGTPSIVISPKDSTQLANAIVHVMSTDLRDRFFKFSEQVQEEFDVTRTANSIRQLYLYLLDI
jgi:glycosyltransferase involved in cell wall biosynthesis